MAEEKKRDVPFDVAGLMESAFLMGVGVFEMTKEKSSEVADDLIERGKMSKSDAKDVADKMTEVAAKQQEVVRSTVAKETDRAMKTAGVATKEDLDELRSEIAESQEAHREACGREFRWRGRVAGDRSSRQCPPIGTFKGIGRSSAYLSTRDSTASSTPRVCAVLRPYAVG